MIQRMKEGEIALYTRSEPAVMSLLQPQATRLLQGNLSRKYQSLWSKYKVSLALIHRWYDPRLTTWCVKAMCKIAVSRWYDPRLTTWCVKTMCKIAVSRWYDPRLITWCVKAMCKKPFPEKQTGKVTVLFQCREYQQWPV